MLSTSLQENLSRFEADFDGSADFILRRLRVAGLDAAFLSMEGMVNKQIASQSVLTPLVSAECRQGTPMESLWYARWHSSSA